jgi:4-hydroxy-tetrahydrodipicolinate synthase
MKTHSQTLLGAITALITPFVGDRVDEDGLRSNIRYQLANEIDGLLVLGSTGEASTLTPDEQQRAIVIAAEEIGGKIPLWVGTGSYCTRQTIEKTKTAHRLGADIALVVTPYYNRPTQEGLFRHFEAVANSSPLPIVVYNIPGRCGTNIDAATLLRIAALPNIVGVKEASGNIAQVSEILHTIVGQYPHFRLFAGDDNMTLPMMALGAVGVVSVASNLLPQTVSELVRACQLGDFSLANRLHRYLYPLCRMLMLETNPIPIKAAMTILGRPAGDCRLPLCGLSPHNYQLVQMVLEEMGLLEECLQ